MADCTQAAASANPQDFDYLAFATSSQADCPAPSQEELFSLAQVLIALAADKNLLLATAESCTGGLVSGQLTSVPGSSAVVLGGVTSYAITIKHKVLQVSQDIIDSVGVVSSECASAMAHGVAHLFEADLSVSTTGIAGPGGAEPNKPVGTVWFGLHSAQKDLTVRKHFSGDRETVRKKAVACACALLLYGAKNFEIGS